MTGTRSPSRVRRRDVGMFVALSRGVMLLSELIIIYLAAAAPFGVASFLRRRAGVPRPRALLQATGTALLWPLTLLFRTLMPKKFSRAKQATATPEVSHTRELRIDDARRTLLSSLYRTGDLAEAACGSNAGAAGAALRETLAAVERYVGLSLAVTDADEEASHAPRETELCRISGRTGDDLHIAGLCHRRRNNARLRTHQSDSRLELLHALAGLREFLESAFPANATEAQSALRPLFASLLETYTRAIDLLSLFEDEQAAGRVARLLDATRARLRRLESLDQHAAPESPIQTDTRGSVAAPEDEPCTTPIPHTNPQTQLPRTQTIRAHG